MLTDVARQRTGKINVSYRLDVYRSWPWCTATAVIVPRRPYDNATHRQSISKNSSSSQRRWLRRWSAEIITSRIDNIKVARLAFDFCLSNNCIEYCSLVSSLSAKRGYKKPIWCLSHPTGTVWTELTIDFSDSQCGIPTNNKLGNQVTKNPINFQLKFINPIKLFTRSRVFSHFSKSSPNLGMFDGFEQQWTQHQTRHNWRYSDPPASQTTTFRTKKHQCIIIIKVSTFQVLLFETRIRDMIIINCLSFILYPQHGCLTKYQPTYTNREKPEQIN